MKSLGTRQRRALKLLAERGTLESSELGCILHAERGLHLPNEACEWCCHEGTDVLFRLWRRRLVDADVSVVRAKAKQ